MKRLDSRIGSKLLLYAGGAWMIIEAINFFVDKYQLHAKFLDVVVLMVIFGLPARFVYALYGDRFVRRSLVWHGLILVLFISSVAYFIYQPEQFRPTQLRLLNFKREQKQLAENLRSIVILPFGNFTGTAENDYLSSGIHEALINEMAKISSLKVTSRVSSLSYANSSTSLIEIANKANANGVIEGSLMSVDSIIRLQIRLISPYPEETQLFAQAYEASMSNLMNVYGDMVRNIATEINVTISPEEQIYLAKKRQVDPDAYEAYLKGVYSMTLLSRNGAERAIQYYNQAIELDPKFAEPYAGLAGVWAILKQMDFVTPREANPLISSNLEKAMSLDTTSANIYFQRAIKSVWTDYDWNRGEREFRKAIQINPSLSNARGLYSHLLTILHRRNEANEQMKAALEIDPANPFIQVLQSARMLQNYEVDSAVSLAGPLQKLMPTNALLNVNLLQGYFEMGDYDKSFDQLKIKIAIEADTVMDAWLEELYTNNNLPGTCGKVAEWFLENDEDALSTQTYAWLYHCAGDEEKVLDWMEQSYIRRTAEVPYFSVIWYHEIYDNPRYLEMIRQLDLPRGKKPSSD